MIIQDPIDLLQILIALASLHFAGAWAFRLKHWPMLISVLVCALFSAYFLLAYRWQFASNADLNLMSSLRTLLMAIIIGSVPFAVRRSH